MMVMMMMMDITIVLHCVFVLVVVIAVKSRFYSIECLLFSNVFFIGWIMLSIYDLVQ